MANTSITAPLGFEAAGVACGVKASGKKDVALLVCAPGTVASAVFTTNQIVSAAVEICRQHVSKEGVRAVVANAGNANACTGAQGLTDAKAMCQEVATLQGVKPHQVLVASTGIIGQHLPMPKIRRGIRAAHQGLSTSAQAGGQFARAIMTTDTRPKQAVRQIEISGSPVTLAGAVKGAGMIGPNMATTLGFLTTDLAIDKTLLNRSLQAAIGNSLNKLTVDGHQSTNDTAILLASGQAGNRPITKACPRYRCFLAALTDLCDDLARQMALDAEGAKRMFKVVVTGAASQADAARAARAVADYDLVKCAVHGGDPNWGRIICAVGSTSVKLDPRKLTCRLDDLTVFWNGTPATFNVQRASRIVAQQEHTITVDLGVGKQTDFCYGVELSRGYVRINADYHT